MNTKHRLSASVDADLDDTATSSAAGIAEAVGTLTPGLAGDVIVTDADPLADIGVLRGCGRGQTGSTELSIQGGMTWQKTSA